MELTVVPCQLLLQLVIFCSITNHLKTQQLKTTIHYYLSCFCRLLEISARRALSCSCDWGWCHLKAKLGWTSKLAHSCSRQSSAGCWLRVQLRLDGSEYLQVSFPCDLGSTQHGDWLSSKSKCFRSHKVELSEIVRASLPFSVCQISHRACLDSRVGDTGHTSLCEKCQRFCFHLRPLQCIISGNS